MANPKIKHSDQWGECIDRVDEDLCETRWFDTTSAMDADDFNRFLGDFASVIEESGRSGVLVDATHFMMPMEKMSLNWRDENITPRYNAAGVKKFAFLMPTGMPAIGAEPAIEGPAKYPTAYFGTRQTALDWLQG